MIRTQKRARLIQRPLVIVGIVAVLIVIGGFLGYKHHQDTVRAAATAAKAKAEATVKPTNTVDYSPARASDNAANEQRKDNPSQASPTLNNGPTSSSPSQSVSVTITRVGKDQSGQNLQVASLVEGATSGICTITASRQGQPSVTRQVSIEQQANAYACPVVNIPLSDFPEKGAWNVSASVTSGGQTKTTTWAANPVTL